MKKIMVGLLMSLAVLPCAAQLAKFPVKAAENLKNLERIPLLVERALARPRVGATVVTVPQGLVSGDRVLLTQAALPWRVTPASASLVTYKENLALRQAGSITAQTSVKPIELAWIEGGGQAFYTRASALARDLERFYGGKSTLYRSPEGRLVRLYALPVDGILYKPAEAEQAVVLQSQDYCIVYDVENRSGQLLRNAPELYTQYKPYFTRDGKPQ